MLRNRYTPTGRLAPSGLLIMPIATAFEREKREVEAIIASGIFNRAPNLAHLLSYVCAKYFEGAAADIKEYNIAVEALGRPPEFDQKRDSIVRVEAHRLRKRLREYYEREGADHEIRIQIPSGQYTPSFVASPPSGAVPPPERESSEPIAAAAGPVTSESWVEERSNAVNEAEIPPQSLVQVLPRSWLYRAIVIGTLVATGVIIFGAREGAKNDSKKAEPTVVVDSSRDIRILAGVETGSYVDAFERTWQSDRYFSGGYIPQTQRVRPIMGTRDHQIYQNRREGSFRYDIPLAPGGTYELRLYFAETVFGDNNVAGGGETTRIFDVSMKDKPLLSAFDVINDAGSGTADIKVFKDVSPSADGKLHLSFTPQTNPAFVNAIEIVPSAPARMLPVRIVARDRGIKDSQNRHWDPDRYAQGGQLIARPESSVTGADPELFRSERFGNITYTIPVPQPGRYGVSLHFAENWFGPGNPGGGGAGSRIFDILINGVAVRRNFDIFRESGGLGHSASVALHGVEPTHQGKIVIALSPARNYACINALEIVDESR